LRAAARACLLEYERGLAERLVGGLEQLDGVRILGITDRAAFVRRVPTVAFVAEGVSSNAIAEDLARRGIFAWSGHNYAVEAARALGIYESGGAVRIGPVHYNTVDEIDTLIAALDETLARARAA